MTKVLILEQKTPENQLFMIAGPAHIGRCKVMDWAVKERPMPEEFGRLELLIVVDDDIDISRNHAGILPDSEGFNIVDLNSLNGTYVNRERINAPVRISVGDEITIGNLVMYAKEIKDSELNHHALLVGNEGGNLRGITRDLDEIARSLDKRGFHGNITRLYNQMATTKNIGNYLRQVSYLTTSDSHFFFYFSGHGNDEGISLADGCLKPIDLYDLLRLARGKRAMVLDCCHAGVFLDEEAKTIMPPNTLVLAASSKHGKAFEGPEFRIAGGNYMGDFSAALVQYLKENRQSLDLSDFQSALNHRFKDHFTIYQSPSVYGESFTMRVAHTQKVIQ